MYYSARDLADITGVPLRTVQYYLHRRLLSPPLPRSGRAGGDKYKQFSTKHLHELREIVRILEANMTLEDIRDYLHGGDDDD